MERKVRVYPCGSFARDRSPHICISHNGVFLKPVIDLVRKMGVNAKFAGAYWELFVDFDVANIKILSRILREHGIDVVVDEYYDKIRWFMKRQYGRLFCKHGINELCYRFSRLPR